VKIQWHIREALPADSPGLQSCMEAAYAIYQDRLGGVRLPPMDADYASEISDYPTWVVESDDRIAGGLIMVFEDNFASIANVAVHPDFQGQGLGSGLMKFADTTAVENGYLELRLATHVLLRENVALYRHLGWSEIGRDDVRVRMMKRL